MSMHARLHVHAFHNLLKVNEFEINILEKCESTGAFMHLRARAHILFHVHASSVYPPDGVN